MPDNFRVGRVCVWGGGGGGWGGVGGYLASVCLLKSELLLDVQAGVYRSQRK